MPTLTLLKSQSQQNASDTLPLQHILPMTPQKRTPISSVETTLLTKLLHLQGPQLVKINSWFHTWSDSGIFVVR